MTEAHVRQLLAPRYEVRREIGRGGMATVYLANDLVAGREVAVKVFHREIAAVLGPGRFRQEIELLGQLHHPRILPLLEAPEAESLLYYTTPFVAGESLRARLERSGPLPLEEVLLLARDIASALDYAHSRNVLHRDVKPDNILLDGEHALICDFGVARAIERAGGGAVSSSGLIIGTPEYMSPEQAQGRRELDARSDIYSLGCVLYEMLSGDVPFTGPTAQVVFARQIGESPRSIRTGRPEVPIGMEAAVLRSLAKDPRTRPESGRELMRLLGAG